MSAVVRSRAVLAALAVLVGLVALSLTACAAGTAAPPVTTADASTTASAPPSTPSTTSAAPTTTAAAAGANTLAGRTIVLDPGHAGGNGAHSADIAREVFIGTGMKACDTSGTSTYDGYPEHAHNWDVTQRLATLLRAAGATVVLTRDDALGWGPCIDERARIGNDARADAVVSIHADGGPDAGRGFHVLHPLPVTTQSSAIAEPSKRLAVAVRDAFARITGMPTSTYLGATGLMPRGDLGGLNLSTVPKVFLEAGNMRNATDAALLSDPGFRQLEAEALVAGLAAYFSGA